MINKLDYGIEICQEETRILYEYEQPQVMFVYTPEDEGAIELDGEQGYADIVYRYLGDNSEVRDFIMDIASTRNKSKWGIMRRWNIRLYTY